jgi:ATP-dependent exoDNAse (exonuclease V) beta subunit
MMRELDKNLQEDAINRARALEHRSFIVEAPAGAGKTELLTQRFLSLLAVVDSPEEIIAITFTNKAAAEMRQRILESLQLAALGTTPAAEHKKVTFLLSQAVLEKSANRDWYILENPARLRIFTIDGLCAYLARQMPLLSSFGAQPVIADDPTSYYQQAAEATISMVESADEENQSVKKVVLEALRYFNYDSQQLSRLLTRMLSMRDQWLHHAQKSITPIELAETLQFVLEEELAEIVEVLNWPLQSALMPLANVAAANVEPEHPISPLLNWQVPLTSSVQDLPQWRALADLLLTKEGGLRKKVDKNIGFPPDKKDEKQAFLALLQSLENISGLEAALARLRTLPTVDAQSLETQEAQWQMIATLSSLLNLAAAQLWLIFIEVREVDFTEVAKRATQALSSELVGEIALPTDLALRLDYQVRHLLVDEFQDTSPNQVALLEKLTQGWQADDGRTLFAVGDPMQSIYRFRKANVGLFLNAARYGIGDVKLEKLRLYRNNRSCPAVVDWINHGFKAIFPPHDAVAKGAIGYRPFTPTRAEEKESGVKVHAIVKPAEMSSETAKKIEAQKIIDIILQERAQNPTQKIALLVRAKSHLQAVVSALRRHHPEIKFQAVEIEALIDRQIIQDLLALTRALHHRADRVSWLAVLRAPWCGLNLHDLHALAGQDHHSTIWQLMQRPSPDISEDGLKRIQYVRGIFAEAFAFQARENISRWLRGVWLMLGGAACLWEKNDINDVQAFFDCVETLDRNGKFTLERLDDEIRQLFAAPDAAGEHLQMMTIHKSKGLEFDTVILPGLGAATNGHDEKPIVLWEEINLPDQSIQILAAPHPSKKSTKKAQVSVYDYLSTLENGRARHEDARVLYVAATRAEKRLHFVGVANQNGKGEINPAKNSYLELLWPLCSAQFLATGVEMVDDTSDEALLENFIPQLVRRKRPELPTIFEEPDADVSIQKNQQPNVRASQTHHAFEADIGTLTHQYLEIIAKQGVEKWSINRIIQLKNAMQHWFKQRGFDENLANTAALQVQTLLQTTLNSEDGQWVLQAHEAASAELALSTSLGHEAKQFVVDRTFITLDNDKKTRWIIDYKTDAIATLEEESAILNAARQHLPQVENYAKLFFDEGLPIKCAVFFVSIGRLISF